MATRVVVGLIVLLAVVESLAAGTVPGGIAPLLLVVLGIAYAAMTVDAEDATAYLVVTLAVGAAAGADVLSHVQVIGAPLDGIVDHISTALYAGVAAVLAQRVLSRLKG